MIRTKGEYWSLIEPARSAALYAQYWQQKATILGLKSTSPKSLVSFTL
jgi:hypothetical protein